MSVPVPLRSGFYAALLRKLARPSRDPDQTPRPLRPSPVRLPGTPHPCYPQPLEISI